MTLLFDSLPPIWGRFLFIFALDKLNVSDKFYFRSRWPNNLENVSRLKFSLEEDTTIHCLVIALLLLIRYVTLWPWPLTLVSGHTWRVTYQHLHQVWRSYGYLFLSYEFWHLRGYHWQCARNLCVGGQILPRYLKSLTQICLLSIQLLWHYDEV